MILENFSVLDCSRVFSAGPVAQIPFEGQIISRIGVKQNVRLSIFSRQRMKSKHIHENRIVLEQNTQNTKY